MKDCVLLREDYDIDLLIRDYEIAIKEAEFIQKKYVKGASVSLYKNTIGWSSIALHSVNGEEDHKANVLKHLNNNIFKPTRILQKCEYFKKILDDLGTDVYLVRMMKLDARGYIAPHNDGAQFKNRLKMIRCHIPIITNEGVKFGIDNNEYYMEAGKLWYSRVDKSHWVKNDSDIDRIHLVIDIKPTVEMIRFLDIKKEINNKNIFKEANHELIKPSRSIKTVESVIDNKFKNFTSWKQFNFNSNILYLSFANFNETYKTQFDFYNVLNNEGYKKFFVRDLSCTWYFNGLNGISNSIETTLNFIKKGIQISKATEVRVIGKGNGGFAALLFGTLLNADNIMVYNPVTYITPKLLKSNNPKRQNKLKRMNGNRYLDLQNLEKSSSIIQIFYTTNNKNILHVENIKNNKNLNIHTEKVTNISEFNKIIIN